MIPERAVFAIFPYLITRERVRIRGIDFRSNQDIADLPADVQEHLTTLSQMFFLEDGVRIEQMICATSNFRRTRRSRRIRYVACTRPDCSSGICIPIPTLLVASSCLLRTRPSSSSGSVIHLAIQGWS